jgi:hypothetical protein
MVAVPPAAIVFFAGVSILRLKGFPGTMANQTPYEIYETASDSALSHFRVFAIELVPALPG